MKQTTGRGGDRIASEAGETPRGRVSSTSRSRPRSYNYNPWMLEGGELSPLSGSHSVGQLIGRWYETSGSEGMAPGPDPSYLPTGSYREFRGGSVREAPGERRALARWATAPAVLSRARPRPVNRSTGTWPSRYGTSQTVAFTGVARGIVFKRNNMRNVPKTHIRDIFGFAGFNYSFETVRTT